MPESYIDYYQNFMDPTQGSRSVQSYLQSLQTVPMPAGGPRRPQPGRGGQQVRQAVETPLMPPEQEEMVGAAMRAERRPWTAEDTLSAIRTPIADEGGQQMLDTAMRSDGPAPTGPEDPAERLRQNAKQAQENAKKVPEEHKKQLKKEFEDQGIHVEQSYQDALKQFGGDAPKGKLTDEDKAWALFEMGIGMMQAASQPGATFIGSLGTGAQRGSQYLRGQKQSRKQDRQQYLSEAERKAQQKLERQMMERELEMKRRQGRAQRSEMLQTSEGPVQYDMGTGQATPIEIPGGAQIQAQGGRETDYTRRQQAGKVVADEMGLTGREREMFITQYAAGEQPVPNQKSLIDMREEARKTLEGTREYRRANAQEREQMVNQQLQRIFPRAMRYLEASRGRTPLENTGGGQQGGQPGAQGGIPPQIEQQLQEVGLRIPPEAYRGPGRYKLNDGRVLIINSDGEVTLEGG